MPLIDEVNHLPVKESRHRKGAYVRNLFHPISDLPSINIRFFCDQVYFISNKS